MVPGKGPVYQETCKQEACMAGIIAAAVPGFTLLAACGDDPRRVADDGWVAGSRH